MNAVRIRKRIDSNTLHVPELRAMIGKEVEIIVLEEPAAQAGSQDLTAVHEAAGKIDLDWDAIENLRYNAREQDGMRLKFDSLIHAGPT